MRTLLYLCLLLIASSFSGEVLAQKLVFEYDAAGNQVSREWVCVNCSTVQMMNEAAAIADTTREESGATSTEEPAAPFQDIRTVSVYPNPVSETLHVQWASDLDIPVKEIYLNSTTGTLLLRQSISPSQHQISISFSGYPPGSYWLRAVFGDGRRESITVIKVD